jgi:type II secretory pathway pseudopilin PulG
MKTRQGFTLIEFLIILGLISVLFILFAQLLGSEYVPRAADAKRKGDLQKIKIAFEDYYNDNSCYPDPGALQNCGSDDLAPYLSTIPCDPSSKAPYFYEPDQLNQCDGYRLLTVLRYEDDPSIVDMPCYEPYNYGLAEGIQLVPPECAVFPSPSAGGGPGPSASPIPSPRSFEGPFACAPPGICNVYADPQAAGCPQSFATYASCKYACETDPGSHCP